MSNFKIVRGWPSEGALDDVAVPAVAGSITAGNLVTFDSNSKLVILDYPTDGSNNNKQAALCIGTDSLSGKCTILMGMFIIETSNIANGTWAPNADVSVSNGKFAVASGTAKVIGKVISYANGVAKIKCSL